MKVILVNGSPHERGCTYTALREAADELERQGAEAEILHIGREPVGGCVACYQCARQGACVFDDAVNRLADRLSTADGVILGCPVYYAGVPGQFKSLLDRLFMSAGKRLRNKPAAAVVSARRGGCASAFDDLNKYFMINSMPVVSSQYWNQVHGSKPEDVRQDEEGMQTMRTLARNMAWLLSCIECGRLNGVEPPTAEPPVRTSFIR